MTTDKIRVYDLAKELDLSNKEVIELLQKNIGVVVKSHSSSVSVDDAESLKKSLKPKAPEKKEEKKESMVISSTPIKPKKVTEKTAVTENKDDNQPKYYSSTPKKFEKKEFNPANREAKDFKSNKPFYQGDRPERLRFQGDRPPFGDRPRYQGDKPRFQGERGDRPPFGDRPRYQGDRPERPRFQGDRPPFGDRPRYQGDKPRFQGERGDRPPFQGERKPFNPNQQDGQRTGMPPKQPIKRQFISQDMANAPRKPGGVPQRLDKRKDSKQFGRSKEEREEQERLMHQQQHKVKKKPQVEQVVEKVTEVIIDKPLTVAEFSEKTNVSVTEIVKSLMMQGVLATVNQTINVDTATKLAESFDILVLDASYIQKEDDNSDKDIVNLNSKHLKPRAPVVTIMGHVDHGKTTLLDAIRASKHKIVSTEFGGITQSIGAYTAYAGDKKIVFIDTPGHEAFTAMRARGAQSTDIVILVVAADDGIMPQTIEAINHAKAANVPIIIAVNKIDKEGADPDRVLTQLTEHGLIPEAWGGDTICCKVSAIQSKGLDELLEYVLLVAEMQELKADPTVSATGVVIEAKLDKGKGPVATVLVQNGTLRKGNCIAVGSVGGKIRALLSDDGTQIEKAGPSTPVEILGLSEVPQAGDRFEILNNEKEMKALISKRKDEERESKLDAIAPSQVKKDLILAQQEETHELNIIIKANTHGSAEAVSASIQQLHSKQIFTKVVHIAIGDITEADIMLASASNAIIIGFSVKADANIMKLAQQEGIDVRNYEIIYDILDDIEKTMLGLLQPELQEIETGRAEVRQIFTIGKTGKIAGCYVLDGKLIRNKTAVVERGGKEIFKGNLDMLKRFKEDAKEVLAGYECGVSFDKFNDLEEGDLIISYTTKEIERKTLE
ncbi:MAG: translation initiation factor IF-2 [Candidatus Gastranaerophilales bacterium]|nr:translation initiation factor IF-2 [Candidatus Gastranaerophilales bacterium]